MKKFFIITIFFLSLFGLKVNAEEVTEYREPLPYYTDFRAGVEELQTQYGFKDYVLFYDDNILSWYLIPLYDCSSRAYAIRVSSTQTNVYFLFFDDNNNRVYNNNNSMLQFVWTDYYNDTFGWHTSTNGIQNNFVMRQRRGLNLVQNSNDFYSLDQTMALFQNFYNSVPFVFTSVNHVNNANPSPNFTFPVLTFDRKSNLKPNSPLQYGDVPKFDYAFANPDPPETSWLDKVQNAIDDVTSITDIPTLLRTLFGLVLEGIQNIGSSIIDLPRNFVGLINDMFVVTQENINTLNSKSGELQALMMSKINSVTSIFSLNSSLGMPVGVSAYGVDIVNFNTIANFIQPYGNLIFWITNVGIVIAFINYILNKINIKNGGDD